ncbi:MAG: hypothetical protein KAV00_02750 [Phycisphaerae bacterium]|nr:hypothetical protein [Phycisphaerae bacterium]
MNITKKVVADKIAAYLHHQLVIADLVDWAENAIQDGDFADDGFEDIRNVVARLGVADVRAFGLTWEDCDGLLKKLGYATQVEVTVG